MGNAADWLLNAALAGYAATSTPTVSSIVLYFGGRGYSVFGHVGFVAAVGDGSFTVSEMNCIGLGLVDMRVNHWPDPTFEGFVI
jgi:surface antigen